MRSNANRWRRLPKYSRNHRVFCHVKHDEIAFSEVISDDWQPCLFSWKSKSVVQKKRLKIQGFVTFRSFSAVLGRPPFYCVLGYVGFQKLLSLFGVSRQFSSVSVLSMLVSKLPRFSKSLGSSRSAPVFTMFLDVLGF